MTIGGLFPIIKGGLWAWLLIIIENNKKYTMEKNDDVF